MSVAATIAPATQRRLELAAGSLSVACLGAMESRPWFAQLGADQRAGVRLVTQTGAANFVSWLADPTEGIRLTAEAFRTAPREFERRLSLRQTVELVRIATDVFEQEIPPLGADERERRLLAEGVLRFGREIAFAAAGIYADAAEARGAWDNRLEALVVDAVVRGPALSPADDALSRAAVLGWDAGAAVRVIVGSPAAGASPERLGELRREAGRTGRSVLAGVQGSRLIVLLSEPTAPTAPGIPTTRGEVVRAHPPDEGGARSASGRRARGLMTAGMPIEVRGLVNGFGPGPVVVGPLVADLAGAHTSAREALAGLRAAPGRSGAPRPVDADDLLPERALAGDPLAVARLVEQLIVPLEAAGGELLRTLAGYLEGGSALEACARALFVHPNTVRYRLRRVSELTGRLPADPRDALVLRAALIAGRLRRADGAVDGS